MYENEKMYSLSKCNVEDLKLIPLGMYSFVIYCITSVVSLRAVSPQLLVTVSVWVTHYQFAATLGPL